MTNNNKKLKNNHKKKQEKKVAFSNKFVPEKLAELEEMKFDNIDEIGKFAVQSFSYRRRYILKDYTLPDETVWHNELFRIFAKLDQVPSEGVDQTYDEYKTAIARAKSSSATRSDTEFLRLPEQSKLLDVPRIEDDSATIASKTKNKRKRIFRLWSS